jgi:hypothetical protein
MQAPEFSLMTDPTAAKALIERIRRDNTLDGAIQDSKVALFLRQSLKLYVHSLAAVDPSHSRPQPLRAIVQQVYAFHSRAVAKCG